MLIDNSTSTSKWEETILGNVCKLINGFAFKSSTYQSEGIPVIRISDIQEGKVSPINAVRISPSKRFDNYTVKRGDILIAMSGATTGKFGIYESISIAYQNQRVGKFKILNKNVLLNKFLYYLLSYKRSEIENDAYGGAQPNISSKNIENLQIYLPPLPEQHRIVEKIEELFSKLDNARANLLKARDLLKSYRQSVLKAAFEGRLTEEWRKEHNPKKATTILRIIDQDKENIYQHRLNNWKEFTKLWKRNPLKGERPTKPKKYLELKELEDKEKDSLPNLPLEWAWVKIDKLVEYKDNSLKAGPFGSSLKKEYYVEEGYKIYGQEQVISGDHEFGDYFISENKYTELKSCSIEPFDILISLVGTVGKVLILPNNVKPGIINPRLIKISLNKSVYDPSFFKYYFESEFLKSLYRIKSHGATMNILNLSIIKALPYPLLSQKEQEIIVQTIEEKLSFYFHLEVDIEQALQQIEALRQSILKAAFEGRLV